MNKIYLVGEPNDFTGWGILIHHLNLHLKEFCEVVLIIQPDKLEFDAPVFIPIPNSDLAPYYDIKCPRMIGYGFWETLLSKEAVKNIDKYYWIFGGSDWSTNKILKLTSRASRLIQGIDFDRFKMQPYSKKEGFHVFTGGKFEFRKGQDIVIAVMREFMAKHQDVFLVTAWYNQWKKSLETMNESCLIDVKNPLKGLPLERIYQNGKLPNKLMPSIYAQTDIGLFPNRAEGGTNLVLMEYMRCYRPVIASYATGQKDVLDGPGPIRIITGLYDQEDRFHPNLVEIYDKLEESYQNRDIIQEQAFFCQKLIEPFTWRETAKHIAQVAFG